MKFWVSLLVFFFAVSAGANTGTQITREGGYITAVLSQEDSKNLYDILLFETLTSESTSFKTFSTQDYGIDLRCEQNESSVSVCTILMTEDSLSPWTIVYEDKGYMRADIINMDTADWLYTNMNVKEGSGKTGPAHYFASADAKFIIHCQQNAIPIGLPYDCAILISNK